MKKTLLITSSAPGLSGVGGVLIRDMLAVEGLDKVSLAAIISPSQATQADLSRIEEFQALEPQFEWFPEPRKNLLGSLSRLQHRVFRYDKHLKMLVRDAKAFIARQDPEQIWVILNSTTAIDLAYSLLPDLKCDLLVQVWDDPYHLCQQRLIDRVTRGRTMSRFQTLLRRAKRVGVICEEALSHYGNLSTVPMTIVRHGLEGTLKTPRWDFETTNEFRIGFSGSLYAFNAWKTLERGLDQLNWESNGRKIALVVAGGHIEFTSRSRADARFVGWRPQRELHELLCSCDALYLPQSFSSADRALTQLSFPTKLSSYVATGRPVIAHGPVYGSINRFCREHQFGAVCDSLDPKAMLTLLQQLASDEDFRKQQAVASTRVAQEQLTYSQFANGVRELLGIQKPLTGAA